jgi:hypothetical protein
MRTEQQANASLRAADLADLVRERLGIVVHPNRIDRALGRKVRKLP